MLWDQVSMCLQRTGVCSFCLPPSSEQHHNSEKDEIILKSMKIGRHHGPRETSSLCSCSSLWPGFSTAPPEEFTGALRKMLMIYPFWYFPVYCLSPPLAYESMKEDTLVCLIFLRSSRISGIQSSPRYVFVKWMNKRLIECMEKWLAKETGK